MALARNSGAINFHDVREEFKCVMKISPTSEGEAQSFFYFILITVFYRCLTFLFAIRLQAFDL